MDAPSPTDLKASVEVLFLVGGSLCGAITTWALLRRDVADLKKQDELQWKSIDGHRRIIARHGTRLALRKQEIEDLTHRIDEHGKRNYEGAAKGYAEMLRDTLNKIEDKAGGAGA